MAKINIKAFRKQSGFTQEQLAQKIDVDRSTVAKWETGEAMPRADKLTELAKILQCDIADLFDESA